MYSMELLKYSSIQNCNKALSSKSKSFWFRYELSAITKKLSITKLLILAAPTLVYRFPKLFAGKTRPALDRFHDSSKVNALCYILEQC